MAPPTAIATWCASLPMLHVQTGRQSVSRTRTKGFVQSSSHCGERSPFCRGRRAERAQLSISAHLARTGQSGMAGSKCILSDGASGRAYRAGRPQTFLFVHLHCTPLPGETSHDWRAGCPQLRLARRCLLQRPLRSFDRRHASHTAAPSPRLVPTGVARTSARARRP